MADSLKASQQGLEQVDRARRKKGWNKDALVWRNAAGEIGRSTLQRFWRGTPIRQQYFVGICKAVAVDWEEIVDDTPPVQTDSRPDFFAYDSSWVGRTQLVAELSEKLRGSCRLLLILGLTGIGKTALAERLAVELEDWFDGDWKKRFQRANFDYEDKPTDFDTVAARWLEGWGVRLQPEEKTPEKLLQRVVAYLRQNQVLVLIDSLERLLTGNEEEGWGDFASEWWEKFFLRLLSAESCQSRLIVTSQDLPVKLVNDRWKNFWHRHILYGLEESEQVALFEIAGLDVSRESADRPLLLRLGNAYKGHPLVLRTIAGEIQESYKGNLREYWQKIGSKIEEVEEALAEAERGIVEGAQDEWDLHKLTRQVRQKVNKERLKDVFDRLQREVKDAYYMLCAASNFRGPVQEEGWLILFAGLVEDLEEQDCSDERQERAVEALINRFLAEESFNHNDKPVLGQHNLVRSVALEHHKQLLSCITD